MTGIQDRDQQLSLQKERWNDDHHYHERDDHEDDDDHDAKILERNMAGSL